MVNPTHDDMHKELAEMAARIKKLESAVFDDGPGGFSGGSPPNPSGPKGGLGERLNALADQLAVLKAESAKNVLELDKKIDDVLRITAELTDIIKKLETKVGPTLETKAMVMTA